MELGFSSQSSVISVILIVSKPLAKMLHLKLVSKCDGCVLKGTKHFPIHPQIERNDKRPVRIFIFNLLAHERHEIKL